MRTIRIIMLLFIPIGVLIIGCKKHSSAPISPNYTSKIGGIRYWVGTLENYIYSVSDSIYNINDTFAIIVLSDTTIRVPDGILNNTDSLIF